MINYLVKMWSDKMRILKAISFILTLILIPFLISLIANYTTWFGTKERVEMTLTLEGHITVGSIMEKDIPDLALTWRGEPIENILKLSWRVENSGTKGIPSFEYGPILNYPEEIQVASSTISLTSPMLKVNPKLVIDPIERHISVADIGILNRGDFFLVDVYVTDVTESAISSEFFDGWNLEAKALDLDVKKDLGAATKQAKVIKIKGFWWFYIIGVIAGTFATIAANRLSTRVVTLVSRRRKG